MKLLCTGDFHLGSGADYGASPGDRLADQEKVLQDIVALAIDEDVDAVLFAGDAFERRTPTPTELMVWRRFATALRHEQLPLLSIAGNHDVSAATLPTGMEVVGSCGRTPEVTDLGGVSLATLPWTPPANLVAAQGGGDRDRIHERAAELLLETARGLRAQIDGTALLLGHWSVSGASLPNGLPVADLREPVLDVEALEEQGWDYVVLGHIHKAQMLGSEDAPGPIFYTGSPMPLNFGEANTAHGVWLLDTAHGPTAEVPVGYRYVEIESRPFVTVDVDLTVDEGGMIFRVEFDATDVVAAAIAEHFPLTDAVVRIRYRATAEQARRVDHAALRKLVDDAGAHKLYAIQPDIVRSDRARVSGVDEQMGEIDAASAWAAANELAEPAPFIERTGHYLEEVRG